MTCIECMFEGDCAKIDTFLSLALKALREGNVRRAMAYIGQARRIAQEWI